MPWSFARARLVVLVAVVCALGASTGPASARQVSQGFIPYIALEVSKGGGTWLYGETFGCVGETSAAVYTNGDFPGLSALGWCEMYLSGSWSPNGVGSGWGQLRTGTHWIDFTFTLTSSGLSGMGTDSHGAVIGLSAPLVSTAAGCCYRHYQGSLRYNGGRWEKAQNTSSPQISGDLRAGQTLTASPGEWTSDGPLTYSYLWRRCDADGHGCHAAGAGQTYTLTADDVGHMMSVTVFATNADGMAFADSPPAGPVASG